MNRAMLIVVGALIVLGAAIALTNPPSVIERIRSAQTCNELARLYFDDLNELEQSATRDEAQERAMELGC